MGPVGREVDAAAGAQRPDLLAVGVDRGEPGEREPLVPTLQPLVYANRFRGGGVTIWALHNATGHTVDGPLLAVRPAAGQQLRELLGDRPLAAPDGRLRLLLRRDETVLVGLLPSRAE
ncbi:MAG: hypothetical protein IT204_16825 [Fimbriimonadaceae bacterium]|nr:hypothetical protein [Fimbriimonadaceae bacterium]